MEYVHNCCVHSTHAISQASKVIASTKVSRPGRSFIFLLAQALALEEGVLSGDIYIGNGFVVEDFRMQAYDMPRDGGIISYGSLRDK